jgi:competence protein ComGC
MLKRDMNVHSTSSPQNTRKSHPSRAFSTRAMTLVELICVTVVLSILVLMIIPARGRRAPYHRIKCVNNLKNVGLAFRIYATDYNNRFPFEVSTNAGGTLEIQNDVAAQFRVLSNELSTPKIVLCPADRRRKEAKDFNSISAANISYYVGLDASQNSFASILSGDSGFTVNGAKPKPGLVQLAANDRVLYPKDLHPPKHAQNMANVCLADGSVHQFRRTDFSKYLTNSGVPTNRLILP